ncbi:MAG: hypothetical protein KDB14_17725 [Planctomycetales bacterium]|nr:hypothetical protein [Planctomycetales bacterium]
MNTLQLKRTIDFKLPMAVLDQSLTPDGLIAACMDGVYFVRFADKSHQKIDQHESYVSSVRVVAGGARAISAGYDGALHWHDLRQPRRERRLQLHEFWSWDMRVAPNEKWLASVTGQYLAGGYKYEPQAEREPSVRVVDVESGELLQALPHVPSVQAVACSPDSQFVAAGNLMGEVRVWNVDSGELVADWTTPDFTSWGIIKSHCYLGGVFALEFTPDGADLLLAGMGPMRDPMAGNGRQLWQRWRWRDEPPRKISETKKDQAGEGLMETLAFHPSGEYFAMGGRLRGGAWNLGLFSLESGDLIGSLKTGYRVTEAQFTPDGRRLVLVGTQGQPSKHEQGRFPDFGRVEVYEIS